MHPTSWFVPWAILYAVCISPTTAAPVYVEFAKQSYDFVVIGGGRFGP